MIDQEKVRKGIAFCLSRFYCGEDCPYYDAGKTGCMESLQKDTLELLKEQEAVQPIVEQYALPLSSISVRFIKKYYCGICKEEITGNNVFCHKCGRKVEWDENRRMGK